MDWQKYADLEHWHEAANLFPLVSNDELNSLGTGHRGEQGVARTLALRAEDSFWQARYYDFNVWSHRKFIEKLRYIHRNPVKRGLVANPEDWEWSSFRHYLTGERGVVEIESHWTARERERAGIVRTVRVRDLEKTRPKLALSE